MLEKDYLIICKLMNINGWWDMVLICGCLLQMIDKREQSTK
jgi:hypothetical protein